MDEAKVAKMHHQGIKSPVQGHPKTLARSCTYCRVRKIRCDAVKPQCTTCASHNRECVYHIEAPRKRPTIARITELQEETASLQSFILGLKYATPEERDELLAAVPDSDSPFRLPNQSSPLQPVTPAALSRQPTQSSPVERRPSANNLDFEDASDDELDVAPFISVDEGGQANSFGPSSALHLPSNAEGAPSATQRTHSMAADYMRTSLIANAALQRQREPELMALPDIDGVPTELAMHLLELHWNRQHHTFLLTYRPAIMRDLVNGGPCCSLFLLNALFACSAKFSQRLEVRDDPAVPATSGRRFFKRCDELLVRDSLLIYPKLPTVVGLLLLGSTYNARGETSKGWLYTGYALRMVYDLGLHIDRGKSADASPEEVEMRRRVFWGAFVCDKLQSLYLGRPVMINLRDAHVSRQFMDSIEEREMWAPYIDPQSPNQQASLPRRPTPIYSVSTFQNFCSLSKIMTAIITKFYVVGATASNATTSLQQVDNALQVWHDNLPAELHYEPWSSKSDPNYYPPPNLMILHSIHNAMIILLHRPFISDGHLRSTTAPLSSWKRCTTAAQSITSIALAYQTAYTLISAPYILSYAIYVACTIHVRNAAAETNNSREQWSLLVASLQCLEELSSANPGVSKPANIIKKLMAANKLDLSTVIDKPTPQSVASLDLSAIFDTFPPRNIVQQHSMEGMNPYETGALGMDFFDPLYGLMDHPQMPYSDLSEYLFNSPVGQGPRSHDR